jgi:hypothetical protein
MRGNLGIARASKHEALLENQAPVHFHAFVATLFQL